MTLVEELRKTGWVIVLNGPLEGVRHVLTRNETRLGCLGASDGRSRCTGSAAPVVELGIWCAPTGRIGTVTAAVVTAGVPMSQGAR